jgi:hypothetical protein
VSPADEFRALDLRCHTFLDDVPHHDVWIIDLAGGGPGRTMRDVDAIGAPGRAGSPPLLTRALFAVRFAVGRALGWDQPRPDALTHSYLHRLSDDDRARSLLAPGTMRGLFRLLYFFADETLSEIRNATVHAFLVMALRPRGDGYRLYWAIYVKPVGRLTRIYMAAIDPFRRLIVYPALIRQVQAAWARAYP